MGDPNLLTAIPSAASAKQASQPRQLTTRRRKLPEKEEKILIL